MDILFVPGLRLERRADVGHARTRRTCCERLAQIGRLIVFDKRGTGCSDRNLGTGSAEERMDDLRAVADAAGVENANLIGVSEGGPLAVLFATTFPERVRSLVLWGTFARALWAPDYEDGLDPALVDAFIEDIRAKWGTGHALEGFFGEVDDEPAVRARALRAPDRFARRGRDDPAPQRRAWMSGTRSARSRCRRWSSTATGDPIVAVAAGEYLARAHPRRRSSPCCPATSTSRATRATTTTPSTSIEEFVTGAPVRRDDDVDRVLKTVLFTDIVDSTRAGRRARRPGVARRCSSSTTPTRPTRSRRNSGVVVKRTGDGLLATFDGPGPRRPGGTCGPRRGAAAGHRRSCRPAHRRDRAARRRRRRASACTSARGSARWPARARCSSPTP